MRSLQGPLSTVDACRRMLATSPDRGRGRAGAEISVQRLILVSYPEDSGVRFISQCIVPWAVELSIGKMEQALPSFQAAKHLDRPGQVSPPSEDGHPK